MGSGGKLVGGRGHVGRTRDGRGHGIGEGQGILRGHGHVTTGGGSVVRGQDHVIRERRGIVRKYGHVIKRRREYHGEGSRDRKRAGKS